MALLFLSAFLVPVGVRAVTPPPLTTLINDSSNLNTNQFNINSTITRTVVTITVTIPAGHTGILLPGAFGSNIDCNPCSDGGTTGYIPYYVYWYFNSTQVGYTVTSVEQAASLRCFGCATQVSFGLPNNGDQSFIGTVWTGPTTIVYQIEVFNAFPSSIPSTLQLDFTYANLYVAET